MEARELRIGNFVTESFSTAEITINQTWVQILSVDGRGNKVFLTNNRWCKMDNIKPTPITEEWLVKFGFEKNGQGAEFAGWEHPNCIGPVFNTVAVDIHSGLGSPDSYAYTVYFKYVHQLQNLYFALTGKELTTI